MKKKKVGIIVLTVAVFLLGGVVFAGGAILSSYMSGTSGYQMDGGFGVAYNSPVMESDFIKSESTSGAYSYDDYDFEEAGSDFTDLSTYGDTDQKWIVTVSMSAETKEYDDFMSMLNDRMKAYGAYAEDTDEWDRGGYYHSRTSQMTIRVPVENLDAFLTELDNTASILSKSRNMENITLQYSDTEAYKESLELEQAQLMELLTRAETVDEIIQIRDRLSSLQYQIEQQGTRLRTYDDKVAFATVRLSVSEVVELSRQPMNFFERAAKGILQNLNDIREFILETLLWLVSHSPAILLIGLLLFVGRKVVKKHKHKKLTKEEDNAKKD